MGQTHTSPIHRRRSIFGFFLFPIFMMFIFMGPFRNFGSIYPILFVFFGISLLGRAFRPRFRTDYEESIPTTESTPASPSPTSPPQSYVNPGVQATYHAQNHAEEFASRESYNSAGTKISVSRFCPGCGNPFSDSDQEVLRNQHYIYCGSCGFKTES